MIDDEMTPASTPAAGQAFASDEPASGAAAPAKRRPGRPRKKPVEAADATPAKSEPAADAVSDAASDEKPAPRRRARRTTKADDAAVPKKARTTKKAAGEAQAASAEPSADAHAAESAPAPSETRRRRARAAERDEVSASENRDAGASALQSDAQDGEARPVVRRRPGRSTMLRASIETQASDADRASDTASAVQDAPSEEAPSQDKPARRRPGRPPKAKPSEKADAREDAASDSAADQDISDDGRNGASEKAEPAERCERPDDAEGKRSKRERQDHRESKQHDRRQGAYERRQDRQDSRSRQNGERRQDRNRDRLERQDRSHDRRQRRGHEREPMVPKTSMEELSKLKVAELREKAAELELDVTGLKKAELVAKVFEASVRAEGFIEVEGVLDTMPDGYGFLRTKGYLPSENDVYVGLSTIRRNGLRKGDYVKGQTRPARPNEKYAALQQVSLVNGDSVENQGVRVKFGDLTPVFPDECLSMEHGKNTITARVIDLVSPIGKGQRGLIVSPPKAGKTTVLKDIAAAITANNPEVHLMCLLVDERPEEVTDMQRSIKGEVIASTFDMPTENHIAVSELVIERAKRLVERGEDVVILLDSLTRLARAYNLAQPASGRILSGGVDSTALYPPKRFLGAARNIEGGGSLTILASALIDTGSKMDEVIFEEFKGTGNMELKLDRSLAERRVFPAIDPVASGTRREELLLDPQEAPLVWAVRRILSNMNSTERAMDMLIRSLKQTKDNQEFLLRTAKKAQNNRDSENMEF